MKKLTALLMALLMALFCLSFAGAEENKGYLSTFDVGVPVM